MESSRRIRTSAARLGESPLPGQGHVQVKVGLDIAGVQPERDRIVPESLVNAPLVRVAPEVIMGLGEGGLETGASR